METIINDQTYVTIWSKSKYSNNWIKERSHPYYYAKLQIGCDIGDFVEINGRYYAIFEENFNPNTPKKL